MDFLGIGGWEILLILLVLFMVLGPSRLPWAAKAMGKGMRKFREVSFDLTKTLTKELEESEEREKTSASSAGETKKES